MDVCLHIPLIVDVLWFWAKICAHNMPPSDLEGLRETFEAIDKDHSGTISLEELTNHLQVMFSILFLFFRLNLT